MSRDYFRYDLMVQDALRGVVRDLLRQVASEGLPGDHHFYIAFKTKSPGVKISPRFQEKYPDEMTIVIQHQFWDLEISDDKFEIGLSFNNVPEKLVIPFSSLTGFMDPSTQFGLQFEPLAKEDEAVPDSGQAETDGGSMVPAISPSTAPAKDGKRKSKISATTKKSEEAGESGQNDDAPAESKESEAPSGEIVQLDAFRKKS